MRNFIFPLSTEIWMMPPRFVKVLRVTHRQDRHVADRGYNLGDASVRDPGDVKEMARRERHGGPPTNVTAIDRPASSFPFTVSENESPNGPVPDHAYRNRRVSRGTHPLAIR